MVADETAFYVGSQNLYPGGMSVKQFTQLSEHGFIVVSKSATEELLKNYNP